MSTQNCEVFNTVFIKVKNVYGKPVIYPANEQAELLAQIAGTKTLTNVTLALAERMGFFIQEVIEPATKYGKPSLSLVTMKGAAA